MYTMSIEFEGEESRTLLERVSKWASDWDEFNLTTLLCRPQEQVLTTKQYQTLATHILFLWPKPNTQGPLLVSINGGQDINLNTNIYPMDHLVEMVVAKIIKGVVNDKKRLLSLSEPKSRQRPYQDKREWRD